MFGAAAANNGNIGNVWTAMPFFYKIILVTTLGFSIIGFFIDIFQYIFINIPNLVFKLQIWRLFTSWMIQLSFLNTLFGLLNLYFYLPNIEKKLSTSYTIVDFIITNFIIQVLICVSQFIGLLFFYELDLYGCGIWGMWMIYLSRQSYATPQVQKKFCCFPFSIKSKYFPVAFLTIFSLFGIIKADLIIAFIIGLIGYAFYNNVLIRYPAKWITGLQGCLPQSIRRRTDFISTNVCRNQLISLCRGQIPINQQLMPSTISGNGTILGSNQGQKNVNQQQIRQFWANKNNNSSNQQTIQMNDTVISNNSQRQFI